MVVKFLIFCSFIASMIYIPCYWAYALENKDLIILMCFFSGMFSGAIHCFLWVR